mgnify:CR=1 FL=1
MNQRATQALDGVTQATVSYDSLGRQAGIIYGNGTSKSAPTYDASQRPLLTEFKAGGFISGIEFEPIELDGEVPIALPVVVAGEG